MRVSTIQFGKNLKIVLKEKNISQNMLSEISGIHYMTINQWATGKSLPCAEYLVLVAKILDVTVDDLMNDVVKE